MDLLRFLTDLLQQNGFEDLLKVLSALKEANFDIKTLIRRIDLEKLIPVITEFVNKKGFEVSKPSYLAPVSSIADKEIVYTLNKYFSNRL